MRTNNLTSTKNFHEGQEFNEDRTVLMRMNNLMKMNNLQRMNNLTRINNLMRMNYLRGANTVTRMTRSTGEGSNNNDELMTGETDAESDMSSSLSDYYITHVSVEHSYGCTGAIVVLNSI